MSTPNNLHSTEYSYLTNLINLMQIEINILKYYYEIHESSIRSIIRRLDNNTRIYTQPYYTSSYIDSIYYPNNTSAAPNRTPTSTSSAAARNSSAYNPTTTSSYTNYRSTANQYMHSSTPRTTEQQTSRTSTPRPPTATTSSQRRVDISMIPVEGTFESIIERLSNIDFNEVSHKTIFDNTEVFCKNYSNENVTQNCTVCLEEINEGDIVRKIKKCGHMFHLKCADTWFKEHIKCPYCRQDIRIEETNETSENRINRENGNAADGDNGSASASASESDRNNRYSRYYTTLDL